MTIYLNKLILPVYKNYLPNIVNLLSKTIQLKYYGLTRIIQISFIP